VGDEFDQYKIPAGQDEFAQYKQTAPGTITGNVATISAGGTAPSPSAGMQYSQGYATDGSMRPSGHFLDRATSYMGENLRNMMNHPVDTIKSMAMSTTGGGAASAAMGGTTSPGDILALYRRFQGDPAAGAGDIGTAALTTAVTGGFTPKPFEAPVPRVPLWKQAPSAGTEVPSVFEKTAPPQSNRVVYPSRIQPSEATTPARTPAWQANPQPVQEFKLQGSTPEEIQAQLQRMANRPRTMRPEGAPPEPQPESPYQVVQLTGPKTPTVQGQTPNLPEMQPAQSTTILQHGYDPVKQQMFVQFKNGNIYRYSGVPQKVFDQYSGSESQGSFHSNNIKGRYTTDLVGRVKPTPGQQVKIALQGGQQ